MKLAFFLFAAVLALASAAPGDRLQIGVKVREARGKEKRARIGRAPRVRPCASNHALASNSAALGPVAASRRCQPWVAARRGGAGRGTRGCAVIASEPSVMCASPAHTPLARKQRHPLSPTRHHTHTTLSHSTAPTTAPSKSRRATRSASTTPAPCATAPSLTRPSTGGRRLSSRWGLGECRGERESLFLFLFCLLSTTPVSNHRLTHPPPAHRPHSQVIKGWDQGLLGACVGEKRKLQIPPDYGYGPLGSPPKIPPNAQLIFDTEVMSINGKPPLN